MNAAARNVAPAAQIAPARLIERAREAVTAADKVLTAAKTGVRARIAAVGGDIDTVQHSAHGLAWLATTVEGLRQMVGWAERLTADDAFGEFEQLILAAAFAEYLAQVSGGIPMNQGEVIRPDAMGIAKTDIRRFEDDVAVVELITYGSSDAVKAQLAAQIAAQPNVTTFGHAGLDDIHGDLVETMRRFSVAEVIPHAHEWHLKNEYIPLEIIGKLADRKSVV